MDGLVEIFLFCGVLCYFFNLRPNNMMDVLSTRLQEVYAKWETRADMTRNTKPTTTRFSLDGLRGAGQQIHRRRIQEREQNRKIRESTLFKIKETEPLVPSIKQRTSFLRNCCCTCTPTSKDSLVNAVVKYQQPFGVNILVVEPGSTVFSKVFKYVSQVSNFKRFHYPMVTQTVLNDERLKEVIQLSACETANSKDCNENEVLAKVKVKAKNILLQMESTCSDLLLKIVSWLMYKMLPSFIKSAIVLPSQVELLKKANETGLPLVFLPLHRSHLDYVMISFIMVVNNMRNPLIAAGDNLRIPFFGWLLRGLGAFYIKRRIDVAGRKDVLYRTVLQTYIMESLRAGHNMEFFMEGGRTRTGKPCMPKSGILSVIIDAYMSGTIEDALLIPAAMNYERLVDGNFVREQLGQPKKMETFASTIKAMWSTLRGHYGIVKVDFCQPFSLREMVKTFQAQQNMMVARPLSERPLKSSISSTSIYGTDVVVEEHRQLVDRIARHVLYDSSKSTPIMSTNVVAMLLLSKFRNGCTLNKLIEAFDSMRQELEQSDKDVAFCGESIDIVKHALDILGPSLVTQQQETTDVEDQEKDDVEFVVTTVRPILTLPSVIELSYYSNTMLVQYIMDSIIITALYAELQSQINDPITVAENNITVYQHSLIDRALKLCDILRYEFIFCRPCQELRDVILETIQNLSYTGIITQKEEVYLEEELWSKRYARNFDDSSDEEYSREQEMKKIEYKLSLMPEHFTRMEFLHTILRPLIDTYICSAFILKKLVGRSLPERDLLQEALSEIKTNLDSGAISYGESLCVDPIKNSFKLYEKWDVLDFYMQGKLKMFCLKEEYDMDDKALKNIYDIIAVFKWTKSVN